MHALKEETKEIIAKQTMHGRKGKKQRDREGAAGLTLSRANSLAPLSTRCRTTPSFSGELAACAYESAGRQC